MSEIFKYEVDDKLSSVLSVYVKDPKDLPLIKEAIELCVAVDYRKYLVEQLKEIK